MSIEVSNKVRGRPFNPGEERQPSRQAQGLKECLFGRIYQRNAGIMGPAWRRRA